MSTENKSTSLKFLEADIQNYKNIKSKVVKIDGKSLVIFGGNGQWKSSFFEALLSAFDGSVIAPEPIKEGEEKASVKVKIGGEMDGRPVEYTVTMFFTEGNKKGRLLLERADGEVVNKPATVLKNIIGDISFDIFDFLKMKPDKQVEILKKLTGKQVEIDTISMNYKKVYDERTEVNSKIKQYEALIAESMYSDTDIDKYEHPIDVNDIQEELNNIGKAVNDFVGVENKLDGFKKRGKEIASDIEKAEQSIEEYKRLIESKKSEVSLLLEEMASITKNIEKGDEWLARNKKPDTAEIMTRLNTANDHNKHHDKVKELRDKHQALIKEKNIALAKTEELKQLSEKKEDIIKGSSLPVKDLTFTDSEVLYKGLPLDTRQINTAEIMKIGMSIGMALNPNLKCLFIKDASLLDRNTYSEIVHEATEKGYQTMSEFVDFDANEAEIHYTEDFLAKRISK